MLGAVLAGGRSSRFGTDKAVARYRGQTLIAHAIDALSSQCDAIVMVGRDYPGMISVADWPAPDYGPLGGFAGAFNHAVKFGFELVLTCAVDNVRLPADLRSLLGPAPAYVASQPILGLWPANTVHVLTELLSGPGTHSVRAFADRIGARAVKLPAKPANVNTPADLARLEQCHGV